MLGPQCLELPPHTPDAPAGFDIDHYEGRFGIEDTRRAACFDDGAGVNVFGVTVDREAQSYFPTLFGRGGYAIVNQVAKLPSALPAIYRHLVR